MSGWYFCILHGQAFLTAELVVLHLVSKLPTVLKEAEVDMVDGIAPVEKCAVRTLAPRMRRLLGNCFIALKFSILTLRWSFGTHRIQQICPYCLNTSVRFFSNLLIHDPTCQQKRSHWEHWEAKTSAKVLTSKWIVPTTLVSSLVGYNQFLIFWMIFWGVCLTGFMLKLAQVYLTVSYSSPKRFAHVWSVAGNHHPQEVWWRSLHHWQVPQGRLLLFDLNQGGRNQSSTASISLQNLLPNHQKSMEVFIV